MIGVLYQKTLITILSSISLVQSRLYQGSLRKKNAHRKVNFKDKFPSELMNSNYFFMGLKSKGCMRDKKFSILV